MFTPTDFKSSGEARAFCEEFAGRTNRKRFIFGRNEHAESIAALVDVDGFIDDFTDETSYLGKPVLKTEEAPPDSSLVVCTVLGRPLTAEKRLKDTGINHLDYFSFYRYSGLNVKPVTCWEEFNKDFAKNRKRYDWIFDRLSDHCSRLTFSTLINFRLTGQLAYMVGFTDRQDRQYFEDFLELRESGETFVDVGGYDGYTTLEFIKRCPDYKSVHLFEPHPDNLRHAKDNLSSYGNIRFHQIGLSEKEQSFSFQSNQSASRISQGGDLIIQTKPLDDIISEPVTFIKMDIEGAEAGALEGAQGTIKKYHPRLAIAVYHKGADYWKIPEQVLAYREDYDLYMRHYTEGVDETVMFFMPR